MQETQGEIQAPKLGLAYPSHYSYLGVNQQTEDSV